jgi:hypothetical protein
MDTNTPQVNRIVLDEADHDNNGQGCSTLTFHGPWAQAHPTRYYRSYLAAEADAYGFAEESGAVLDILC